MRIPIRLHSARFVKLALTALAALALAACAAMPQKTPEQTVAERAKARWEALFAGDLETAYSYYSPGYRSSVSLAGFKSWFAGRRVIWESAVFESAACQASACKVDFRVEYHYKVMGIPMVDRIDSVTTVNENWVLSDREWYYVAPSMGGRE